MVAMASSSRPTTSTPSPTFKRSRTCSGNAATKKKTCARSCTGTGCGSLSAPGLRSRCALGDGDPGDDSQAADHQWHGDALAEQNDGEHDRPEGDRVLKYCNARGA